MSTDVTACTACGVRNRIAPASVGIPHCPKCDAVLPWLVAVDDSNFDQVAARSSLPVLLDLWAPWCPPCRAIAPAVESAAARFAGRLKVAKLNVDDSPRTAGQFGVQGIPTLLILRNGKEVDRQVGVLVGDTFPRWIEQAIAKLGVS
jgi:thioredoxin 2